MLLAVAPVGVPLAYDLSPTFRNDAIQVRGAPLWRGELRGRVRAERPTRNAAGMRIRKLGGGEAMQTAAGYVDGMELTFFEISARMDELHLSSPTFCRLS